MTNVDAHEIIRSQNFIPKCDFWFAITAVSDSVKQSESTQMIVRRSDVFGDYINRFDVSALTPRSIVFCKFDYLQHLVKYLQHKNCKTPFTLLTGQSDYTITDSAFDWVRSKIPVSWWGCNNECTRAHGVPLGIADDFCTLTVKSSFEQTKANALLYVNHRTETFPGVRKPLYSLFSDKSWATVRDPMEKGKTEEYRSELLNHKFILCPRGNGVDTHRMWEALYCGVIPVVQRHEVHSFLEGKLPILFVDSYYDVTEELLNKTYTQYRTQNWNTEMLKVSWWLDLMRNTENDKTVS